MRDVMAPLAVEELLAWARAEEAGDSILGIPRRLVFEPREDDPFRIRRFGALLETPIGVAAGPHTQLAGNIAAAWLAGSRFIELKTVQVLDELEIPKPCIHMADEGYNCEWSQELTLDRSFTEYLAAWLLIRVLQERLGLPGGDGPGFLFNMSVGYDLEGVTSAPVQRFLDRMEDPAADARALWARARRVEPLVDRIEPPAHLSRNVTLSTMHGCPPEEIERIALHLIRERGLHTAVKLNPTLLGPETVRGILHDRLGWPVEVPDAAFEHDPGWDEALSLIRSLSAAAQAAGVAFSVKLTNTLEVKNPGVELPGETLYLSGRALHPLAVTLAARLQAAFGGELDLSFAGGADHRNIPALVAAGLAPVTVCSDLLKPGGYGRQAQYLEALRGAMEAAGAADVASFILATAGGTGRSLAEAALANLQAYAARAVEDPRSHASAGPAGTIEGDRALGPFDCVHAPCVENCATGQEVPAYIRAIASGDPDQAFAVILRTNPLPAVTGQVCDHLCQDRCTRVQLDDPLLIRELKRYAEEAHTTEPPIRPAPPAGRSAAIVGAGPSGLSCAWFLRLAGWDVEVLDRAAQPGGMVSATIPAFRLLPAALERDMARIEALGVRFRFGHAVDAGEIARLRNAHDAVYLAVGAGVPRSLGVPGEDLPGVLTAYDFLARVRRGEAVRTGPRVAVVGGGNAAMDAARTALRLAGPGARVTLLYRRTRAEMPADRHEVEEALAEGVELRELVAPTAIRGGTGGLEVELQPMRLGEADGDGRRRPVPAGRPTAAVFDTVIIAVGQRPILDRLGLAGLEADPATGRTGLPGVYLGGDALRGPATVIAAVGDGRRAAAAILEDAGTAVPAPEEAPASGAGRAAHAAALARRIEGTALPGLAPEERTGFEPVVRTLAHHEARREAARCLDCDLVCDVCVTVCPNRAMLALEAEPVRLELRPVRLSGRCVTLGEARPWRVAQLPQVLNLADLCNECGNCATFCPTAGAPYRDKIRLWLDGSRWAEDDGAYLLEAAGPGFRLRRREGGREETLSLVPGEAAVYTTPEARIELHPRTLEIRAVQPLASSRWETDLHRAATMWAVLRMLRDTPVAAALRARSTARG